VIYLQLQQYALAAREFSQTLQFDAQNADAFAGLGWTSFHNALQSLDKAQRADKAGYWQDGQASRHDAQVAWVEVQNDFRSADALLAGRSTGADTDRRRAAVHNGQAWVELKLRSNESALELFKQAAQQDPGNPDYHLSAGNVYWMMAGDHQFSPDLAFTQRIEAAIAEYERAQNLANGTRDAAYRGWIYRTLGQFYYLLRNQAAPHDYQKEMEHAVALDEQAFQLDPQPDYLDLRGRIGYALGDHFFRQENRAAAEQVWQTAWADMERARSMGHPTAKGDLAGRLELAGQWYQSAAQQSGQAGDWAAALDYFRRANGVDPNTAAYLRDIGWTYHLMGQDSQAITPTLQAIDLARNDPVSYFSLGLIHLSMGQADQAVGDYQNALKVAAAQKADAAKAACTGALANLNQFNQKRPASVDESVVDGIIVTIVQKCLTP
jgi:tetratricopeptide (TPR) repeat protein